MLSSLICLWTIGAMKLLVCLLSLLVGAFGEYIIGFHGHERIPFDVTVKNGYIYTLPGRGNVNNPAFRQSATLTDFNKHLEARKVIEEDACYIRKEKGAFDKAVKMVHAAKSMSGKPARVSEQWNIPGEEIPTDKLEETVGERIAKFCTGYKVFWMAEGKQAAKLQARYLNDKWSFDHKGFSFDDNNGFKANLKPTYDGGPGIKGDASYDNGKGFTAKGNGSFDPNKGFSGGVNLNWEWGK